MAFVRSLRFKYKGDDTPSPASYQLPSIFDENHSSTWARPCTCDDPFIPRANSRSRNSGQSNISNEPLHRPLCPRSRPRTCTPDDREKDGSHVCKKKNASFKPTEPRAPSFMTRPRQSTHNCFANSTEDTENAVFDRPSGRRRSIKLIKEIRARSNDSSEEEETRQLNVSYTIPNTTNDSVETESNVGEVTPRVNRGAIPKTRPNITDEMTETDLENLDVSSTEDNTLCADNQPNTNLENSASGPRGISEKNEALKKAFFNKLDLTKIRNTDASNRGETASNNVVSVDKLLVGAARMINTEVKKASRVKRGSKREEEIHYLSSNIASRPEFLVNDQFIDDDYETYIRNLTLEKLVRMEDINLFQLSKSLVYLYMKVLTVNVPNRRTSYKVKTKRSRKRNTHNDMETLEVRNKSRKRSNKHVWTEVEKIVRSTITNLKEEFKKEILKKTEAKMDSLMFKLTKMIRNADNSIEKKCERTTVHLLNRLERIIQP